MTKDEALKMAIQEIEYLYNQTAIDRIGNVLNACKEALEQPAQECKWCKSREVNFDEPEPNKAYEWNHGAGRNLS